MKLKLSIFGLFLFVTFVFLKVSYGKTSLQSSGNTTYFIDNQNGHDEYNGLSPDSAWKSLTNVNSTTFQAGDSILFKTNCVWNGNIRPNGSGENGNPIVMSQYGEGEKPIINGQGELYTIFMYNQEYWEINNLEITNYNENDQTSYKTGVYVQAKDFGVVHYIHINNLVIHDVNGNIEPGNTSKNNGGIFFQIKGSSVQTYFDDILIQGCHIYDVDRTGISLRSEWDNRTLNSNSNWTPSYNVVIRNNMIERSGGNGLIWRVSHKPLIEHNIFHKCATKLSGNAMFFFNCDSAIGQYNEAYLTVYEPGETDAGAFDADYRCKNTIYQYNYSHDNGEAAFVAPTNGNSSTAFQVGVIFRYNISQNDKREVFHISGPTNNTKCYNNTVYLGSHLSNIKIIYHKSWGGYPTNTSYYNNIIYNLASSTRYSFGNSTNNDFDHNVFYGNHPSSEPNDAHKITDDPMFVNPGGGEIGINTVNGYMLKPDSPCIDSGLQIANNGGEDYWGNSVPVNNSTDRGAHEYQGNVNVSNYNNNTRAPDDVVLFQNFPNPFNSSTNISFELSDDAKVKIQIFSIEGKKIFTLFDNFLKKGFYTETWNGLVSNNKATSGIYLCRMEANSSIKMIKMILVK